MTETIPSLTKESLSWREDKTINAYLATVEDDQPRTRPVSILWREDAVPTHGRGAIVARYSGHRISVS